MAAFFSHPTLTECILILLLSTFELEFNSNPLPTCNFATLF